MQKLDPPFRIKGATNLRVRLEEQFALPVVSVCVSLLTCDEIGEYLSGDGKSFPSSFLVPHAFGRFFRNICNLISSRSHVVGREGRLMLRKFFQPRGSNIECIELSLFSRLFSENHTA